MTGHRLIPLPSICERPRSSRGLRVSSFEPRLKAQEFGLWHPLDSWLIPHLEPLEGSARGIDCVSMRAALHSKVSVRRLHPQAKTGWNVARSSGLNARRRMRAPDKQKKVKPTRFGEANPKGMRHPRSPPRFKGAPPACCSTPPKLGDSLQLDSATVYLFSLGYRKSSASFDDTHDLFFAYSAMLHSQVLPSHWRRPRR